MLRITSGSAKNKKLKVPNIPGYRGVQEVVKLAIFAILGEKVVEAKCLDLYAGSGNLGLEALSRGASWCDFVDESRPAERIIQENIIGCKFTEKTEVFGQDAVKYVANIHQKYDIIFLDPFYDNISHKFLMQNLAEIITDKGLIFFTHGKALDIEKQIEGNNLKVDSQRRFGRSYLTVLRSA